MADASKLCRHCRVHRMPMTGPLLDFHDSLCPPLLLSRSPSLRPAAQNSVRDSRFFFRFLFSFLKAALRAESIEIWATDLSPGAVCMHPRAGDEAAGGLALPPDGKRLAVVMGRELDGVSETMLAEADRRVYLPMVGFTESFNLSVATALTLQSLFTLQPSMRGDLSDDLKQTIREDCECHTA